MSWMLTVVLAAGLSQGAQGAQSAQASVAEDPAAIEREIRKLVLEFNVAYGRNDLDRYFSYYAEDVTFWYPSGRENLAGYKEDWYGLIEKGGAVEKCLVSDLQVQVSPNGDAAVATYELAVDTRMPNGELTEETALETDVWFKRAGAWKIVHVNYHVRPAP